MNPRPKFCVGEEVIIQALNLTAYNGQTHEILKIEWRQISREPYTGEMNDPAWGYLTTADEDYWDESALRKLPPAADPWKDCAFNPTRQVLSNVE